MDFPLVFLLEGLRVAKAAGDADAEETVQKGAELQVYFFHKKEGKGKVESFATAGAEHCEGIARRKDEFKVWSHLFCEQYLRKESKEFYAAVRTLR